MIVAGRDEDDDVWALVVVARVCVGVGFAVNALYIKFFDERNDTKVLTLSTLGEWRRDWLVCIGRFCPCPLGFRSLRINLSS